MLSLTMLSVEHPTAFTPMKHSYIRFDRDFKKALDAIGTNENAINNCTETKVFLRLIEIQSIQYMSGK